MNITDFKPGDGVELPEDDSTISIRSATRRTALQALYQWQMNHLDPHDLIKEFSEAERLSGLDIELFRDLVNAVSQKAVELDEIYVEYIDRTAAMIDPIERNIMRMGTYELQSKIEIPYKVIINEAVELAKCFGAEDSHKYINGVLDKVAQQLRALEMEAK